MIRTCLFLLHNPLNIVVKNAEQIRHIEGVSLPQCNAQQIISWYVDDKSFIVRAKHASVDNLVEIAPSLEMNWQTSVAYRCRSINGSGPLLVTCRSHQAHCLVYIWNCRMLINLFDDKVKAKLKYSNSTNLSLVGKTFIVNRALMSSLWYFIVVWVGSKKVLV